MRFNLLSSALLLQLSNTAFGASSDASTSGECDVWSWEDVFDRSEFNKHYAILTSFRHGPFSATNTTVTHAANISIFDFTASEHHKMFLDEESLKQLEKPGSKSEEDRVITLTAFRETGLVDHSDSFMDHDQEHEEYHMPDRKDLGPDFRINSRFELRPEGKEKILPTKLTGMAFSKEYGLRRGADYNFAWEISASDLLHSKTLVKDPDFKVAIEFNEDKYLYLTGVDLIDVTDEELESIPLPPGVDGPKKVSKKLRKKVNKAAIVAEIDSIGQADEVEAMWVEDEFGRVVFFKKTTSEKQQKKIVDGSRLRLEFNMFSYARDFVTLMPFIATKEKVLPGKPVVIPLVDDEECILGKQEIKLEKVEIKQEL